MPCTSTSTNPRIRLRTNLPRNERVQLILTSVVIAKPGPKRSASPTGNFGSGFTAAVSPVPTMAEAATL